MIETRNSQLDGYTDILSYQVSSAFRRRFRQRAAEADLKLTALLREALEAWEEKQGILNGQG